MRRIIIVLIAVFAVVTFFGAYAQSRTDSVQVSRTEIERTG